MPEPTLRLDYQPPTFLVPKVSLDFDLDASETVVTTKFTAHANPQSAGGDFLLDGEDIQLHKLLINGAEVLSDCDVNAQNLVIPRSALPRQSRDDGSPFEVEIVGSVIPAENASGSGLYIDGGGHFMTQCEANGFRKISYFPDRPDVLSLYESVTLRGDTEKLPVLLSNGNLVSQTLDGNRQTAVWSDPHPKPSYLFALVAGNLRRIQSEFVTKSGRRVDLFLYSDPKDLGALSFAMESLKQAMSWDEKRYGLEYDLNIFNIVATDFFNMGAMENKSLNVFNTSYLVGGQHRSTDADLEAIASVVAHEYFHNWTGNRVTCRDWFQLTLKEGLTVFRDQQFSSDVVSNPSVQRIDEVAKLKAVQFKEDASGIAHPIRPDSVVVQDNFYTTTVYEKGAEVIRMIHSLLSEATFQVGMDMYFERFDGKAVTCDDFRLTMADAAESSGQHYEAGILRGPFERWYDQDGTPNVTVDVSWRPENGGTAVLTFAQECEPSPSAPDTTKEPFVIPLRLGFFNSRTSTNEAVASEGTLEIAPTDPSEVTLLHGDLAVLERRNSALHIQGVAKTDLPSLNRAFSAPVKLSLNVNYDAGFGCPKSKLDEEGIKEWRKSKLLSSIVMADSDPVNRYEAAKELSLGVLKDRYHSLETEKHDAYLELYRNVLGDGSLDMALKAQFLSVPTFNLLVQHLESNVDPIRAVNVGTELRQSLAEVFAVDLMENYLSLAAHRPGSDETSIPYMFSQEEVARRRFSNFCLSSLAQLPVADGTEIDNCGLRDQVVELCAEQVVKADNMTDCYSALQALAAMDENKFKWACDAFLHHDPENNALKWITAQAACPLPGALERVSGSYSVAYQQWPPLLISCHCVT